MGGEEWGGRSERDSGASAPAETGGLCLYSITTQAKMGGLCLGEPVGGCRRPCGPGACGAATTRAASGGLRCGNHPHSKRVPAVWAPCGCVGAGASPTGLLAAWVVSVLVRAGPRVCGGMDVAAADSCRRRHVYGHDVADVGLRRLNSNSAAWTST